MKYRGIPRGIDDDYMLKGDMYRVDLVKQLFKVNPAPISLRCKRAKDGKEFFLDYRTFAAAVFDWELA